MPIIYRNPYAKFGIPSFYNSQDACVQTDRQMDTAKSTRLTIPSKNICIFWVWVVGKYKNEIMQNTDFEVFFHILFISPTILLYLGHIYFIEMTLVWPHWKVIFTHSVYARRL